MYDFVKYFLGTKNSSWRLLTTAGIFAIILLVAGCGGKDKPASSDDPPPPPPPGAVDCASDGLYILNDAFTNAEVTNSGTNFSLNFSYDFFVKRIGGQVRAVASTQYVLPGDTTPTVVSFWNIGAKIYMGLTTDVITAAYVNLSTLRGNVTAIATVDHAGLIGVLVGTTDGIAYLVADPALKKIEEYNSHHLPLSLDKKSQIGITSINIDHSPPADDGKITTNLYLTTTNGHLLRISDESVKGGNLGCYQLVADHSAADDLFSPVKSVVVRNSDNEFVVYLAKKFSYRYSDIDLSAPLNKVAYMYDLMYTMANPGLNEVYTKIIAVDLKTGEKKELTKTAMEEWPTLDKWIPQDIFSTGDELVVSALLYNGSSFDVKIFGSSPCDGAGDPEQKALCLTEDGIFDAKDSNDATPKALEAAGFKIGLYSYVIPSKDDLDKLDYEGEDSELKDKTIVEKSFYNADSLYTVDFDGNYYSYDKAVSRIFMNLSYSNPAIVIRGSDFIKILTKTNKQWGLSYSSHNSDSEDILTVGVPINSSMVKHGSTFVFLNVVHALEGQKVSTDASGIMERITFDETTNDFDRKTIASGFESPTLGPIYENKMALIKPIWSDAGKISIYDLKGANPESIDIYGQGGIPLYSKHVTYNGGIYCYDLFSEDYLSGTFPDIQLGCHSKAGGLSNGARITINVPANQNTDVFYNMPPTVGVELKPYHREIADIFFSNKQLFVLVKGFDGANIYTYRLYIYRVELGEGSKYEIKGYVSKSKRLDEEIEIVDGIKLKPDNNAKILAVKSSDTKFDVLVSTIGGTYKFVMEEGEPADPKIQQDFTALYQNISANDISVGTAVDLTNNLIVDIIGNTPRVEIRSMAAGSDYKPTITIDLKTASFFDDGQEIKKIPRASAVVSGGKLYLSLQFDWMQNRFYVFDVTDSTKAAKPLGETRGSFIGTIKPNTSGNTDLIMGGIGIGLEFFKFDGL